MTPRPPPVRLDLVAEALAALDRLLRQYPELQSEQANERLKEYLRR